MNNDKKRKRKIRFLGNPNLTFGDLRLSFDTMFKPVISFNKDDEIFRSDRNEYKLHYWVSNEGDIYNSDTGIYLKPSIKNKYYYVRLKRGYYDFESVYIHSLVAYYFCKGWLVKDVIHHIDGNTLNNHADNLIWVTNKEHGELHKILKSGDNKAYKKRIREIQKENNKW